MTAFWRKCDLDVVVYVGGELRDALATGSVARATQVSHVCTRHWASYDFNFIFATFDPITTLTGTPSLPLNFAICCPPLILDASPPSTQVPHKLTSVINSSFWRCQPSPPLPLTPFPTFSSSPSFSHPTLIELTPASYYFSTPPPAPSKNDTPPYAFSLEPVRLSSPIFGMSGLSSLVVVSPYKMMLVEAVIYRCGTCNSCRYGRTVKSRMVVMSLYGYNRTPTRLSHRCGYRRRRCLQISDPLLYRLICTHCCTHPSPPFSQCGLY
jgi:hypothetical protein